MLWIAYEVSYPGKLHMSVLCKDVGSYSTCERYRFPMGTLVWKVSQILYCYSSGYQIVSSCWEFMGHVGKFWKTNVNASKSMLAIHSHNFITIEIGTTT